jgi:3-hydroxyisobutyrate dehydrogenase
MLGNHLPGVGEVMATVGFIGLGKMGGPVAGHIQRAGFPMVVFDLREEASRSFEERGARVVDSPRELSRWSDVIITALPMPEDVEQVSCGANGILQGIRRGSVYIDISTNAPALIRRLEPLYRAQGAFVLDAPVASGQPGAARGIHEIMVGGDKEIFDRVKPILRAFGDQVLHAGPLGSGSICKLVHQMVNSTISQALAEGLTLGVKAGVDPKTLWECVRRGMVGRMHVLHVQVPQTVFRGEFSTETFPLKLLRKDVGLATALGRELDIPLPLANIAEQHLVEAMNRGLGDKSAYTATFLLQEEAAKVAVRATGVEPEKAGKYISTHPEEI